ncbi:MAG: eukaryotic-like serine/threonine-protein kinase [Acidobacteriota bacterium]|nr:eukaryotic-like serine/threonine-protein kinase [Acidobacteriota bacterium]
MNEREDPSEAGAREARTETFDLGGERASPGPAAPAPLPRGAFLGRYVVLGPIGAGGMGVVYAGYDPELDRKVALKLLHPGAGERGRLRLLREAQAIARLSHPNVVSVYDAGTLGDEVFLAMELVEGPTFRRWLAERPRPLREVLDRFAAAGRGLEAAHQAGLVHRDFKPENVLLGQDGRVRVADFGLVRPLGEETPAAEAGEAPASPFAGLLTLGGTVLGTPAYMAPEQLRGEAADARSDQWSFCVALWEALYGERPFAGRSAAEIAREMARGAVREPPAGRKVPGWVRQALLRGLASDPEARHPDMAALLAALARDPAARRRRLLGAAAAGLLLAGVIAGYARFAAERGPVCGGAPAKLAGVWDGPGKARVEAAFLATRVPYASATWKGVERALDLYVAGWAGMHRETCEATRVRGEQSEDLLDRRMFCLDQRLGEVKALADLFARADSQVVEKAVTAAGALTPLAGCADARALRARVAPPRTPAERARVDALSRQLGAVKALLGAGKYGPGVAAARTATAAAGQAGYRPVAAEARALLGDLEGRAGELEAAERDLLAALWAADAAADDEVKARAAIGLMSLEGDVRSRFEPAHRWQGFAVAALDRLGRDEPLRALFLDRLGRVYLAEGRYGEALAEHEGAVAIERRLDPRGPALAETLRHAGVDLFRLGRYPEALARFEEALGLQKAVLGPDHPDLAATLDNIGNVLYQRGRLTEALVYLRQCLALRERTLAPDHPLVADALNDLGNVLDETGHYEEALAAYRRALAIRRKTLGDHVSVAAALDNIGAVLTNLRRHEEAFDYHRQALEVRVRTVGRQHPSVALTLYNLGSALTEQDRYAEALPYFEEALAINERARGPNHPDVAEDLTSIGNAERHLGHPSRALPRLERALRILEAEGAPWVLARARFALAEVLWETGEDRGRARSLAGQARDGLRGEKDLNATQDQDTLAEIERWLARHRRA